MVKTPRATTPVAGRLGRRVTYRWRTPRTRRLRWWNFVNNRRIPSGRHGHGQHTAGKMAAMGHKTASARSGYWTAKCGVKFTRDNTGSGNDYERRVGFGTAADTGPGSRTKRDAEAAAAPLCRRQSTYAASRGKSCGRRRNSARTPTRPRINPSAYPKRQTSSPSRPSA